MSTHSDVFSDDWWSSLLPLLSEDVSGFSLSDAEVRSSVSEGSVGPEVGVAVASSVMRDVLDGTVLVRVSWVGESEEIADCT